MNLLDIAPPILLCVIGLSALPSIKEGLKVKHYTLGGILIIIMAFAIYQNDQNTDSFAQLQIALDKAQSNRALDSANNASFQQFLKDTVGIAITSGSKATIVNKSIFNKYVQTYSGSDTTSLPKRNEAENYGYKFSKTGDSIFVYPKRGVWIKPFISFESKLEKTNGTLNEDDGVYDLTPSTVFLKNKKYTLTTIRLSQTRSYQRPLILNISGAPNQSIFFGDEVYPDKRYLLENRRVYWVPDSVGQ